MHNKQFFFSKRVYRGIKKCIAAYKNKTTSMHQHQLFENQRIVYIERDFSGIGANNVNNK